jgi:hypothetical protein
MTDVPPEKLHTQPVEIQTILGPAQLSFVPATRTYKVVFLPIDEQPHTICVPMEQSGSLVSENRAIAIAQRYAKDFLMEEVKKLLVEEQRPEEHEAFLAGWEAAARAQMHRNGGDKQ